MYKTHLVRKIFLFGIIVGLSLLSWGFGFNLVDEISDRIQSVFDRGTYDDYMTRAYYSNFSKDPFGDAMSSVTEMSDKLRIEGEKYVKERLDFYNCSMSNKKIRALLYHYVTGYRVDVVRGIKMEQGIYGNKYDLDDDIVKKYCNEFAVCMGGIKTPENKNVTCLEFFKGTYEIGRGNELAKQNVQVSQLGSDKYFNKTTDDSPYDLMEDLGEISKLLFMEAQDPITPVFYDIPAFSKSKEKLANRENSSLPSNNTGSFGDNGGGLEMTGFGGNRNPAGGNRKDGENNRGTDNTGLNEFFVGPIGLSDLDIRDEYDNLLEGLGAYRLTSDGSEFYTNMCGNREESELEIEDDADNSNDSGDELGDFDDLSDEEYDEIVNYMLDAVDDYLASFEDENNDEDSEDERDDGNNPNLGSVLSSVTPPKDDKIRTCLESCKGLRLDQAASCKIKCACGQWNSPIFNSEKYPGLGPIFMMKFCAVPGVDMRFSVGGKRIYSVEEGIREIYGVVDKLSREGRLGTWTQQHEFLDSSTKRVNFADALTFTIDVEFVDLGMKMPKSSEQYEKKILENNNKSIQVNYGISHKLNTITGKNYYRIIEGEETESTNKNGVEGDNRQEKAGADNNVKIESYWSQWLDQQSSLWESAKNFITNLTDSAEKLGSKKCE